MNFIQLLTKAPIQNSVLVLPNVIPYRRNILTAKLAPIAHTLHCNKNLPANCVIYPTGSRLFTMWKHHKKVFVNDMQWLYWQKFPRIWYTLLHYTDFTLFFTACFVMVAIDMTIILQATVIDNIVSFSCKFNKTTNRSSMSSLSSGCMCATVCAYSFRLASL